MNERELMIKYCYRILLDRWPSEEEWRDCPFENIEDLRDSMLASDEFYDKRKKILNKIIANKFAQD